MDIDSRSPGAVLRVPFWAWAAKTTEINQILYVAREEIDGLIFTLPFVADMLPICQAVFTAHALEIKPPLPPVGLIESFSTAKRRIYLTATLADDSVLVTHFDAAREAAERPIVPKSAADLGDRMILAPQEINPSLQEAEIRRAVSDLADVASTTVQYRSPDGSRT
jgi:hypothetical protein